MNPLQIPGKQNSGLPSPFDGLSQAYRQWSASLPAINCDRPEFIQLSPLEPLSHGLRQSLVEKVLNTGLVCYQWTSQPGDHAEAVRHLHQQIGLFTNDQGVLQNSENLSLLRDLGGTRQGRFVPYSNKTLNWHTDGYYNSVENELRCFTLHCISAAADGGELRFLHPHRLLVAQYEHAPDTVAALTHPAAITIPANRDTEGHDRPDRTTPVWFVHDDGRLGLRYTTRLRNISWRDTATRDAMMQLSRLIDRLQAQQLSIRLLPGQGVICSNLLHCRAAFVDSPDQRRQVLRGRYLELPSVQRDTGPATD